MVLVEGGEKGRRVRRELMVLDEGVREEGGAGGGEGEGGCREEGGRSETKFSNSSGLSGLSSTSWQSVV